MPFTALFPLVQHLVKLHLIFRSASMAVWGKVRVSTLYLIQVVMKLQIPASEQYLLGHPILLSVMLKSYTKNKEVHFINSSHCIYFRSRTLCKVSLCVLRAGHNRHHGHSDVKPLFKARWLSLDPGQLASIFHVKQIGIIAKELQQREVVFWNNVFVAVVVVVVAKALYYRKTDCFYHTCMRKQYA